MFVRLDANVVPLITLNPGRNKNKSCIGPSYIILIEQGPLTENCWTALPAEALIVVS